MNLDFTEFNKNRRQQFLSIEMYESIKRNLDFNSKEFLLVFSSVPESDLDRAALAHMNFLNDLESVELAYTSGVPIEDLVGLYLNAVDSFQRWGLVFQEWLAIEYAITPATYESNLELTEPHNYRNAIALISLGVLLGQVESLKTLSLWFEDIAKEDALIAILLNDGKPELLQNDILICSGLYELIAPVIKVQHKIPIQLMANFLKEWYSAYEGAPWHNAHLNTGRLEHDMNWTNYYGYWAFEAAALSVLWNLDDSSYRNHLLYPKDLADYARAQRALASNFTEVEGVISVRCLANEICTRSGYWYTPAKQNSRAQFKQGDVMPDFPDSTYGATIWYWDQNQD